MLPPELSKRKTCERRSCSDLISVDYLDTVNRTVSLAIASEILPLSSLLQSSTETLNSRLLSLENRLKVILEHKGMRNFETPDDNEVLQSHEEPVQENLELNANHEQGTETALDLKCTTFVHSTASEANEAVLSDVMTGGDGIASVVARAALSDSDSCNNEIHGSNHQLATITTCDLDSEASPSFENQRTLPVCTPLRSPSFSLLASPHPAEAANSLAPACEDDSTHRPGSCEPSAAAQGAQALASAMLRGPAGRSDIYDRLDVTRKVRFSTSIPIPTPLSQQIPFV